LKSLLLALLIPALTGCGQAIDLTTARATESAAVRPQEVDFATAPLVTLPDNWRRSRPATVAVVWYSVPLDAALLTLRDRERLAVVVPHVAEEASFWLNGAPLEAGGGLGATRNRVIWLDLPASALRSAGNTLEVRVDGVVHVRSGLSRMRLAPAAELRSGYEARRFARTTLPLVLIAVLAAAFLAAIPLWLRRRHPAQLLFIGLCVLWLPRALLMASPVASVPATFTLTLLIVVVSLAATALVALLALEYLPAGEQLRRDYRRAVLVCLALSALATLGWALVEPLTPRAYSMLHWPIYALLVGLALLHVRAALLVPRRSVAFTAIALAAWAIAVVHDIAMLNDLTAFDSFLWSPGGMLVLLGAFAWNTALSRRISPPAATRAWSGRRLRWPRRP
jgi:hypothetical protein